MTQVEAAAATFESVGTLREYAADDTIYRQHDTADHWYLIVNGAARKCTQISDGRRQIMDFLLPEQ